MHPESDAFLDAIFDHPDDDTPRLVYADWLQEQGEESLAGFMRRGCAIAQLRNHQPGRLQLREQEKKSWEAIKKRWPEFFKLTGARKDWFHRGFLNHQIPFVEDTFFSRYPEWVQWFPISDLQLRGHWHDPNRITECPELLARVQNLRLETVEVSFPPTLLVQLAHFPRFRHLRSLYVRSVRASSAALLELVSAPWVPALDSFHLHVEVNPVLVAHGFEWCVGYGRENIYRNGRPRTIREQMMAYVETSAAHFLE